MKILIALMLISTQAYTQDKCTTIMPKDLTICENQWQLVYDLADVSHNSPTHGFHPGRVRKIYDDGMVLVDKDVKMNLNVIGDSETVIQSWYVLPENIVTMRAEMNGVGAGTVVIYNRKKYRVEAVYDNGKNHPGYYYIVGVGIVRQDFAPKAQVVEVDQED